MKLKNKKTGEVFDVLIREKVGAGSYSLIVCDIKSYEQSKSTLDATHFVLDEYETLAELNADWEDYVPKEPLIKDEKIRKAVRAWADANGFTNGIEVRSLNAGTRFSEGHWSIEFIGYFIYDLEIDSTYTIAELCGEEEE